MNQWFPKWGTYYLFIQPGSCLLQIIEILKLVGRELSGESTKPPWSSFQQGNVSDMIWIKDIVLWIHLHLFSFSVKPKKLVSLMNFRNMFSWISRVIFKFSDNIFAHKEKKDMIRRNDKFFVSKKQFLKVFSKTATGQGVASLCRFMIYLIIT